MIIAVCDDSKVDRELVIYCVKKYFQEKQYSYHIIPYNRGLNLIYDYQDGAHFDIIFIDIFLDGILGIDAARKLREQGYRGAIIFCTASEEYAVDSYDVQASGYLVKPVITEKLYMYLDRVVQYIDLRSFKVKQGRNIVVMHHHEIIFIESRNSKCMLHKKDGEVLVLYRKLSDIEAELADARFLRCHQSYIVNMDYVSQVTDCFILSTGDQVLIRQRSLKEIRTKYWNYVNGNTH